MCKLEADEADRVVLPDPGHGGELEPGRVHDRERPAAHHLERLVRADERRRVLVQADADGERIVGQRGEQPAQPVALAEVLVDDDPVGETRARAPGSRSWPAARRPPCRTRSCARRGTRRRPRCRPRASPPRSAAGAPWPPAVPPIMVLSRSWLPPVRKTPSTLSSTSSHSRPLAVGPARDRQRLASLDAELLEQLLVAAPVSLSSEAVGMMAMRQPSRRTGRRSAAGSPRRPSCPPPRPPE